MKQAGGGQIELGSLKAGENSRNSGDSAFSDSFRADDYESIRLRRMFAYLIDIVCIGIITWIAGFIATILGIISFGALTPVLFLGVALVPVAYNTVLIGGSWNATIGMRFMNMKMEVLDGEDPDYLTAAIHAVVFYLSIAVTSSLILLVSLFNPRGRCLHDFVANVVIRRVSLSSQ
ncbi:MAG: hypothetical protein COB93_06085 [Sneathiella sp.]|nr:MAG: hypothetical protein COB93_06085 [Sneathiella sp.]